MATSVALVRALSRMPSTRMVVMTAMIRTEGRLRYSAAEGVVGQCLGNLRERQGREQLVQVARPGRGHRGAAHGVFQDQVPADDPGEDLAQRGVGVGVGAAGHGGHGGELGVAQGGQGAAHAGDGIGQDHARPGIQGRGPPGDDEDAGADDAAHAQRRQRPGAQHAVQAMLAGRLGQQCFQVLAGEDVLPVHRGLEICARSCQLSGQFHAPGRRRTEHQIPPPQRIDDDDRRQRQHGGRHETRQLHREDLQAEILGRVRRQSRLAN